MLTPQKWERGKAPTVEVGGAFSQHPAQGQQSEAASPPQGPAAAKPQWRRWWLEEVTLWWQGDIAVPQGPKRE